MGVLTHLDRFKDNKRLRKTRKVLKHRFWQEIYQGAKLFYLSGVIHGRYPKMEIHNLARFISVMKFRPMAYRNSHPYVLADRFEDLTDPESLRKNPKVDRTISLYGYVRGTNLKANSKVHIAGVGDFFMSNVSSLDDPCGLPKKVDDKKKKRKTLDEKQRVLYAPMSDVGGILYDRDAVYIDVPGHFQKKKTADEKDGPKEIVVDADGERITPWHSLFFFPFGNLVQNVYSFPFFFFCSGNPIEEEEEEEIPEKSRTLGERMVVDLQDAQDDLAEKLEDAELQIFSHSKPLKSSEVEEGAFLFFPFLFF
jgi:ribosome biogenesis protein BMS1